MCVWKETAPDPCTSSEMGTRGASAEGGGVNDHLQQVSFYMACMIYVKIDLIAV